jgi:hypothetical protein
MALEPTMMLTGECWQVNGQLVCLLAAAATTRHTTTLRAPLSQGCQQVRTAGPVILVFACTHIVFAFQFLFNFISLSVCCQSTSGNQSHNPDI